MDVPPSLVSGKIIQYYGCSMLNSLVVSGLLLLSLVSVEKLEATNVVYNHDCIVGSPPTCNHSLADDTLCRGLYSSDIKAWQSNDCDCEPLSCRTTIFHPLTLLLVRSLSILLLNLFSPLPSQLRPLIFSR